MAGRGSSLSAVRRFGRDALRRLQLALLSLRSMLRPPGAPQAAPPELLLYRRRLRLREQVVVERLLEDGRVDQTEDVLAGV